MNTNNLREPTKFRYVPALGFHCLTPFYDALIRVTGRERTVKQALIEQALIGPGQQVLDLASGTGTLSIWIKQSQPQVRLTGVDGDPKILAIARRKADKARVTVRFVQAYSYSLPHRPDQFDRVISSMFFHHLTWQDKVRTAQEIYRVLKPGAELHLADWGRSANLCMRGLFLSVQLLDGFKNTRPHVQGKLGSLLVQNGFVDVTQRQTFNTIYGTIALYSATKPN